MITLQDIKSNPRILEFIDQTRTVLAELGFTDHGIRHSKIVADRAMAIAKDIGLPKKEQDLAAIAGFCHDMGNFLSRTYHNYYGAILFNSVFGDEMDPKDLVVVMQAISNHDKRKEDVTFVNKVSAIVVLADKSDVDRSRVAVSDMTEIQSDIHDRVNYAAQKSRIIVDKKKKTITLSLDIDTEFVPVMEYFEIFTERMTFCRRAAESLGYNFGLVINKFHLL